jgi:glycosyltransferase involved in cell wall biosynthesis
MNLPQDSVFGSNLANPNPDVTAKKNSFVIMYHGTVVERNGLGVALEAIERVRDRIPNLVFEVYGEGDFVKQFLELSRAKNLGKIINYHGFVAHDKIAQAIQCADVGLIPNMATVLWQYALPTRMFEYLYLGKPVIVPRTKPILDCFDDESLYFFESGNADSLADVLFEVYANPNRVRAVLARGISICNSKYRWAAEKQRFVDVVQELVRNITPYDPAEKTKHLM